MAVSATAAAATADRTREGRSLKVRRMLGSPQVSTHLPMLLPALSNTEALVQ